ncbi:hypothetical protein D3Z62_24815 [Lachnospiraceae bacterium]|jgi:hypothetical protein|nr:hypothetical protein [uncultured Schaedlerella sp.]NBJ03219.1 hypothetical protein [Lachnospiraceae bacterium]
MDTVYWIIEYGKVFCGYLFLMYIWPSVVFGGHLKDKTRTYRFSFCVTVQVVIVNTVVLMLGLFHVLNRWTVVLLFYGIFMCVCVKKLVFFLRSGIRFSGIEKKRYRLRHIRLRIKERLWEIGRKISPFVYKNGILAAVLIFGMAYFSYGAFQIHSYGWGDLYAHHEWIYGLTQGNIFSDGVYPEAMHCFIYTMSMLFGIRVYSILLFLQGIHVTVFLVSVYLLLREVFHWRYSPVFVLMLFLTVDVVSADYVYSMFRLQITLPLEFGLHTQFLCALYLIRYLRETVNFTRKGKTLKFYWDENLFLFMMSLSASISIHFYVTIMAFILCVSFALFALKKILSWNYLLSLSLSVACGCVIAITPMAGALASGIPFNYSIQWAMDAMDGEQARQWQVEEKETGEAEDEKSLDVQYKGIGLSQWKETAEKGVRVIEKIINGIYRKGYKTLYGDIRSGWILAVTGILIVLCLFAGHRKDRCLYRFCCGYPPVILFTFIFMLLFAAPYMGYLDLISDSRFCSAGRMMILAVMVMPADMLLSWLTHFFKESVLGRVSALLTAGIYVFAMLTGNYRGFLFYELSRYNSAVEVTNSIIEEFPQYSYTIVAPTDELYPVNLYGWHEELQMFVEKCSDTEYTLPSEYVFIYVEKKPLLYAQAHFFEGPFWMGEEKYSEIYWKKYSKKFPDSGASQAPEIKTSEISEDAAQSDIVESENEWFSYKQLENRTILESKAYECCQRFGETYPQAMKAYYEDDDFVCYYYRQNTGTLYNLGIGQDDK